MNEVYFILVLLSILFLIEKKAINILITYVGLIITIAILLPSVETSSGWLLSPIDTSINPNPSASHPHKGGWWGMGEGSLGSIEGEYYSYILILIQVSALTILFGFIIMLFPNLSHSQPKTLSIKSLFPSNPDLKSGSGLGKNMKSIISVIVIITSLLLILYLIYTPDISISDPSRETLTQTHHSSLSLNPVGLRVEMGGVRIGLDGIEEETIGGDSKFVRRLGRILYQNNNDIIKLFLLTIILLLAIVALFFLLF